MNVINFMLNSEGVVNILKGRYTCLVLGIRKLNSPLNSVIVIIIKKVRKSKTKNLIQ